MTVLISNKVEFKEKTLNDLKRVVKCTYGGTLSAFNLRKFLKLKVMCKFQVSIVDPRVRNSDLNLSVFFSPHIHVLCKMTLKLLLLRGRVHFNFLNLG